MDEAYQGTHANLRTGRYAALKISDNGSGMPSEVTDRAFEPFFSTKPKGQPERGGGERVLLAEDEPAIRAAAQRILAKNGYQLIAAASGQEAINAVAAGRDPRRIPAREDARGTARAGRA